jgi:ferredoxin-NADP reductase
MLQTRIRSIEPLARDVRLFTLESADGSTLPGFDSGSHVVLQFHGDEQHYANAYSLLNPSPAPDSYRIAVKLDGQSRGGSRWLHERAEVDMPIAVSAPANLFALAPRGPHIFIAGGIGITPFIAHMAALDAVGQHYELHYAFRGVGTAAFAEALQIRRDEADIYLYDAAVGERLDVPALLDGLPPGAHVYVCGPQRLIDAVSEHGAGRIAPGHLHIERFGATAPAEAQGFTVQLARSGIEVAVGPDESILGAIERQTDITVESMCREGYCGTCETRLLGGTALHCDQYLSEPEKAAQQTILICVSRARGPSLTLDL